MNPDLRAIGLEGPIGENNRHLVNLNYLHGK